MAEDKYRTTPSSYFSSAPRASGASDTAQKRIARRLKTIREQKNEDWRDRQEREHEERKKENERKRRLGFREVLKVRDNKLRKIILESGKTRLDRFKNFVAAAYRDFNQRDLQQEKQIKKFDKIIENTNRKLHPLTIKKLQLLNQDPSKKVIPIKKTPLTVTSPESVNTKIKHGYGDKLRVEALRTDPNFKKLSPKAQQKYLEFMHKQIKSNQPMNRSIINDWMGKNLSITQKLQKDYIQSRRLNVIKEELRKLNRQEKAAGRLGEKQRTIIQGIKKPPRGK